MTMPSDITADLAALHAQLRARGSPHQVLLRLDPFRPVLDLVFDLLLIVSAVVAVEAWGWGWSPLSLLLLGNRQRALGNLLHDAAHGNVGRSRWFNDGITQGLIAPLLFANLRLYRATHFRHHQWLGRVDADPDFLVPPEAMPNHWVSRFLACAINGLAWWGSVWGHLVHPEVRGFAKWFILFWWFVILGLVAAVFGASIAWHFLGLWLLARATTFHAITTFREMCDHHGLRPGGVFSYTRDVAGHWLPRALIHPRNNGYHLTHHLLPALPYHRLPQAHALLLAFSSVRGQMVVCDAYFSGPAAVVRAWQRSPAR